MEERAVKVGAMASSPMVQFEEVEVSINFKVSDTCGILINLKKPNSTVFKHKPH